MALTLIDLANTQSTPTAQVIIMGLVEKMMNLGERLPFQKTSILGGTFTRITEIPTLQWRQFGQGPVAVQTRHEQFREGLRLIRENIDVDNLARRDPSLVPNPVRLQIEGFQEMVGYGINDAFINGSPVVDPDEPVGVDYRMRNDSIFHGGLTSGNDRGQVIDAAGLDVDASTADSHTWLDHIHDLMSRCDGKADMLLGNRQTLLRLAGIARRERVLNVSQDMFDRTIDRFGRVPLIDLGVSPAGAVTKAVTNQIFPHNTQTSPFSSTADTSWMVALRVGETYTTGVQMEPISIQEIGQIADNPHVYRIAYVEWATAIALLQRGAAAALYGLVI